MREADTNGVYNMILRASTLGKGKMVGFNDVVRHEIDQLSWLASPPNRSPPFLFSSLSHHSEPYTSQFPESANII